jgi:hypothetical protein
MYCLAVRWLARLGGLAIAEMIGYLPQQLPGFESRMFCSQLMSPLLNHQQTYRQYATCSLSRNLSSNGMLRYRTKDDGCRIDTGGIGLHTLKLYFMYVAGSILPVFANK